MNITTNNFFKTGCFGGMEFPTINLIFATSENGVIGNIGKIPWHIPEDFKHFRETTMGSVVLMGRKTWDSLASGIRPLPGRFNCVLTRDTTDIRDGSVRINKLDDLVKYCNFIDAKEVWVIGGAEIYNQTLPLASTVVVTEVHGQFEGDAFAPTLSSEEWKEVSREEYCSKNNAYFSIVKYKRINQKVINN